jgi:membrane-bound inhibitor of C-type lysozyme
MVAGGLTLAAAPGGQAAQVAEATYRCADGSKVVVRFETPASGPGRVVLEFGSKTMTLPQVLSADGGRYAGGNVEFWIKGRGATFTFAGRVTTCRTH